MRIIRELKTVTILLQKISFNCFNHTCNKNNDNYNKTMYFQYQNRVGHLHSKKKKYEILKKSDIKNIFVHIYFNKIFVCKLQAQTSFYKKVGRCTRR